MEEDFNIRIGELGDTEIEREGKKKYSKDKSIDNGTRSFVE